MNRKTTMNALFFCLLFVAASEQPAMTKNMDTVLTELGDKVSTMVVDGSLSATGQPFQGMTFHVEMDSSGAYLLTMGGPFGITAAKMYAAADTFLMVNYLMQEVWYGNPDSPALQRASHLPIPASDLMALIRNRVPRNPSRFTIVPREDVRVLFSSPDSNGVEYVLVDTTHHTIAQYQRKDSTGAIVLDVAFSGFAPINGISLAHTIVVRAITANQQATVSIRSARINEPLSQPLHLAAPLSFERRKFD